MEKSGGNHFLKRIYERGYKKMKTKTSIIMLSIIAVIVMNLGHIFTMHFLENQELQLQKIRINKEKTSKNTYNKDFGSYELPSNWVESKLHSTNTKFFYVKEGEENQPTPNNISINEGVNKYKESEHEKFKNAITRELSMQIGKDDNITLNANGSKTDNGYIVYTFVIKENEENIVTTQAYIIGDYKYVLIHETTYTSDTEESDQAFKNMVNTFKWNE